MAQEAGDKEEKPGAIAVRPGPLVPPYESGPSSVLALPALATLFDLLAMGLSEGEMKIPSPGDCGTSLHT